MFQMIEITENAARLSINTGRLSVATQTSQNFYPLGELDALILANPAVGISGCVLNEITRNRAVVVICDRSYRPTGILLPVGSKSAKGQIAYDLQTSSSLPLKKQLWAKIVKRKIKNQSFILESYCKDDTLQSLIKLVRSGDADNIEARAAREYWQILNIFPKRDREQEDANLLLNYAYTVLYSATARYICASALHPHIGLKHHNQYNPFCLASDLMEPYRPYADRVVLNLLRENGFDTSLSAQNRQNMLEALYGCNVMMNRQEMNVFNAIRWTVQTYKQALEQNTSTVLNLPTLEAI